MPSAPRPDPSRVEQPGGRAVRTGQAAVGRVSRAGHDAAVGQHQLQPGYLGCHAADVTAGAVRAGLGGAGHRLDLDVAHVGQGQAARQQLGVEHVQRAARLDGDRAGGGDPRT